MKNIMTRPHWLLLLGSLLLQASAASAAGPTNEEESIADFNAGRYSLAVSPDGKWRVHVNAQNELQRTNLTNQSITEQITLPIEARAISASHTASKVAITDGNCVGVVSFSDAPQINPGSAVEGSASLKWLGSECPYQTTSPGDPASRSYAAFSIAISKDGRFVAIPGNPTIKILDADSGRIVSVVPTGSAVVLHLRFIDDDRKLLVVQAILGEQWESPAEGSDMQFAVWDLQSKALFNFHNTQTTGTLLSDDFLWSFSEKTGLLWAINTNGAPWESAEKLAPIHPYLINLKQCGTSAIRRLNLPQTDWVDFAADPLGRWVAVVESVFEPTTKKIGSHLVVRSSIDGRVLKQWALDSEVRSLTPSQDGKTIYATTAGQPAPDGLRYTRIMWAFEGGGSVMEFNLSEAIKDLSPVPPVDWPAQRCPIEGETAKARDISFDKRPRPLLFELPLINRNQDSSPPTSTEPDAPACSGDTTSFYNNEARSWGGNGEHLWIDRTGLLERINLEDGHVELTIPTPRTPSRCSIPLYDREQFISWGEDTILLHPFASTVRTEKVLVKKPGWTAISLQWFGNRFGVRWIGNPPPQSDDEKESDSNGRALAVLYSAEGAELKQTEGFASGNEAHFPGEDEEGGEGPFSYRDDPKQAAAQYLHRYEWSRSHSGSVRAKLLGTAAQAPAITFWDGLRLDRPLDCGDRSDAYYSGQVTALTGPVGVLIQPSDLILFDAEKRQRITGFAVANVNHAEWYPSRRTLVVSTYVNDLSNTVLRVYGLGETGSGEVIDGKTPADVSDSCQYIGKIYQAKYMDKNSAAIANDTPTTTYGNTMGKEQGSTEQAFKKENGQNSATDFLSRFGLISSIVGIIFLIAGITFIAWKKIS